MIRRSRLLLYALLASGSAVCAFWWLTRPQLTAAERGRIVYQRLGCAACHGAEGQGGIPNPGSKEREIPAFAGGTAMMYIESPEEIGEWILDGRPKRLDGAMAGPDALLEMPAFRGRLGDDELGDLVAYYRAIAWYEPDLSERGHKGREAAQRAGCFGCHGPAGQVGQTNPGSLKGYIPGWGSDDYFELVFGEAELREWIGDGVPKRLAGNPIAAFFMERQLLRMPAYRDILDPAALDDIVAYVSEVSR